MKKFLDTIRRWFARILADSFSKAFVNALTIGITISFTFLFTVGLSLISYGLQRKIEVPIYVLLIIILFSTLGLIVIIEKIILLVDLQLKGKGIMKLVIVEDVKDNSREWKVFCKKENGEWVAEKKELYCKKHNLKLLFFDKIIGDTWVPYLVSICSECNNKMVVHCNGVDKKYYFSDIDNKALRKAPEDN